MVLIMNTSPSTHYTNWGGAQISRIIIYLIPGRLAVFFLPVAVSLLAS